MLFTTIATAALAVVAAADLLPLPLIVPGISIRQNRDLDSVIKESSELYGWQLVGMTTSKAQLIQVCENAVNFTKFAANVGLDGQELQAIVCLESNSFLEPDHDFIQRFINQVNTYIFQYHILGSFNGAVTLHTPNGDMNPLAFLCTYALSYAGLADFNLVPDTIFKTICAAGGVAVPTSFDGEKKEDTTAGVVALRSYQSQLFGINLVTGTAIKEGSDYLCSALDTGAFDSALVSYQMYPNDVKDTVCNYTAPIDPALSNSVALEANTNIFIQQLLNMDAQTPDWKAWLCYALDCAGMKSVQLDDQTVINAVCNQTWIAHRVSSLMMT